ncbi:hypothetical protein BGZ72_004436 [Mortierella alpina]|nr:hypothetical protein BGZ72_004436 [Mortierella alpina]
MASTALSSNIGSIRSIRKFGFRLCPSSPLLQIFRLGRLSNCLACRTDQPRFVCSIPSTSKTSTNADKIPPRYNGPTRANARHASSKAGITTEKPKLVTPKISKYRVDCNTSKVIKRAKNKKAKAKATTPVPPLTAKEGPIVVTTTAPERPVSTVLLSKNSPTAAPSRAPSPKSSLSTPDRIEAPGATWDALAALLKVDPVDSAKLQDTIKARSPAPRPSMPPGFDDMATSPPIRRRPSLAPPKITRSVYRTILDWSVHPTVQPDDFNTTVDYGSTPLSTRSHLKASSPMASSTLEFFARSKATAIQADVQNDFTAKRTRSRRRIGFESLDAEIEKSSGSTASRGSFGATTDKGQDRSHAFSRVSVSDDRKDLSLDQRENRTRSGAHMAAAAYTITPPASPPSSSSPLPPPLPVAVSSQAPTTLPLKSTSISEPAISVVENHDYLYSLKVVLPALSSILRKSYTLYHAGSLAQGNQGALEICLEAAQKANVKVVKLNRRQLDILTGNSEHQGIVLEASRLRKMIIKTLGPVSEDGHYELQFKKNYKPVEGEQQPLKLSATSKGSPPLWIVMDEVTDPTVMGEIVRNASYFGVDGVVVRARKSAPLSPAVSKASAGSLETRPVYAVDSLVRFIQSSQGNGWHVAGARITYGAKRNLPLYMWPSTGAEKPTILVLGNDSNGVSDQTRKQCDSLIQVPSLCRVPWSTNSLEGSVFAGMVMARLLAGRLQQRSGKTHA